MARKPNDFNEAVNETVALDADDGRALDEQTDDDQDLANAANLPLIDGDLMYVVKARSGLNVRSGPSTDFPVIGSLPFGARVAVLSREGRWGLVDKQGDGAADGFVHLAFLETTLGTNRGAGSSRAGSDVRALLAERNPRGAKLYKSNGDPLVDPELLYASAMGLLRFEALHPNHRLEIYGPNGGFRTSGSTVNHGAQPGTGRGAALDFVIIDLQTGRFLTNHPGSDHQYQGNVGKNAPLYQIFFNEVVRVGSKSYSGFEEKARFGGYFRNGSDAMDTMHIDMRGRQVPMGGGSLKAGFSKAQIEKWNIPSNHPYS
jgi:hypothetical protein